MCDIAKEHNLFLIGDEAYREFVYAGEPLQSFGEYADAAENIIVIDTVSSGSPPAAPEWAASSAATMSCWARP